MASGKLSRGGSRPAPTLRERWHWAARSRLRLELGGLAFALKRGHKPEDYARELWGKGAVEWMGQETPTPSQYLRKEARGISVLYPWVEASWGQEGDGQARLVMSRDCLAGWGPDRWTLARSLGLAQSEVCRYCQEAFRVWGQQLGLAVSINPQPDGTCLLKAERRPRGPQQNKEVWKMALQVPEAVVFDVRALIPSHRHPLIFSVLEQISQMSPQTPLWIVNDHNPQGLAFELEMRPETKGRYDFESQSQPDGSWLAKMKRKQS